MLKQPILPPRCLIVFVVTPSKIARIVIVQLCECVYVCDHLREPVSSRAHQACESIPPGQKEVTYTAWKPCRDMYMLFRSSRSFSTLLLPNYEETNCFPAAWRDNIPVSLGQCSPLREELHLNWNALCDYSFNCCTFAFYHLYAWYNICRRRIVADSLLHQFGPCN